MLIQELKKLKLQNEVISLRRDCADDDQTGIIESITENVMIFCLYSDEGEFDGYTYFHTEQIYEVMWGNREHKAIALLIKKKNEKHRCLLTAGSFEELMAESNEKYESVLIYHGDNEDSFDIAKLEGHSEEWLKIRTYGTMRTLSGLQKLVQLDNISRVTVDSPYQNNIVKLHNEKL